MRQYRAREHNNAKREEDDADGKEVKANKTHNTKAKKKTEKQNIGRRIRRETQRDKETKQKRNEQATERR